MDNSDATFKSEIRFEMLVREGETGADGRLRADDAVATEEVGIRLQSGSQYMCYVLGLW